MWSISKGRLAGILFGLAFVGLVLYSAVSSMTETKRGTGTPEGAAQMLFDAMSREDVIGVMSVMAPFEVGTSAGLYPKIVDLAVAAEIIEDANWLSGIDFEAEDLEMSTTVLHPDVALVSLTRGELRIALDPAAADPLFAGIDSFQGSTTLQDAHQQFSSAIGEVNDEIGDLPFTLSAPDELFVMTVKHDGKWFVSASYTAAEYGRQILDLPAADFSASRDNAAAGAASPSGVIDGIVELVNSRSAEEHWEAMLSDDPEATFEPFAVFSPPDEFGALLDYTTAYEALLERMEEWLAEDDPSFDTESMTGWLEDIDVQGDVHLAVVTREERLGDDKANVYLESGSVYVDLLVTRPASGEAVSFELDASWRGLCAQADAAFGDGFTSESIEFNECVPDDALPDGFDEAFVVVTETNGSWYISYVETILAYAEMFIDDALQDPEIRSQIPEIGLNAAAG